MIENRNYPNLLKIIIIDLLSCAKFPMILLFLIVISAISVVMITYKTRQLVIDHEKIVLEKNSLEIEGQNLILEETILGDLHRIEHIATKKFNMKHVEPCCEHKIIYFDD